MIGVCPINIVKAEYDALSSEFELAKRVITLREEIIGLTQILVKLKLG